VLIYKYYKYVCLLVHTHTHWYMPTYVCVYKYTHVYNSIFHCKFILATALISVYLMNLILKCFMFDTFKMLSLMLTKALIVKSTVNSKINNIVKYYNLK